MPGFITCFRSQELEKLFTNSLEEILRSQQGERGRKSLSNGGGDLTSIRYSSRIQCDRVREGEGIAFSRKRELFAQTQMPTYLNPGSKVELCTHQISQFQYNTLLGAQCRSATSYSSRQRLSLGWRRLLQVSVLTPRRRKPTVMY